MRLRRVAQGAIAQLVERLHGMQEVRSSILLSSTDRHSLELSKIVQKDPVSHETGSFTFADSLSAAVRRSVSSSSGV